MTEKTCFQVSFDFKSRTVTLGDRVFPFQRDEGAGFDDSYGFGPVGKPFVTATRHGEVVTFKYETGQ